MLGETTQFNDQIQRGEPPCIFLCVPLIFLYYHRNISEDPNTAINIICVFQCNVHEFEPGVTLDISYFVFLFMRLWLYGFVYTLLDE